MRALDIGSGTGRLAEWLQENGFNVLCLDPSTEMVKRCRSKNLTTEQTTIQNFHTDQMFGLITAVLSLIHVPKKDMASQLNRITNWLNPRGTFVLALLIEGSGEGIDEQNTEYPRYFSYYTRKEVLDLTKEHYNCLLEKKIQGPVCDFLFIFQKKS